jgi:hypothetical protein
VKLIGCNEQTIAPRIVRHARGAFAAALDRESRFILLR